MGMTWKELTEENKKPPEVYDEVDYLIICALRENPRLSASAVSKIVGINERTARRRIDSLVASGAIRFATICDPYRFGYSSIFDVNIKVAFPEGEASMDKIINYPGVCYVSSGWGKNSVTLQCKFKSNDEVSYFINTFLAELEGVEVESYYFQARIYREGDSWAPQREDFAESQRISVNAEEA